MQNYNIVVKNELLQNNIDLIPILFNDQPVTYVQSTCDMFDILILCGIFTSRSQAKKNWKYEPMILDEWNEYLNIGKFNKNIYIYKPIEKIDAKVVEMQV